MSVEVRPSSVRKVTSSLLPGVAGWPVIHNSTSVSAGSQGDVASPVLPSLPVQEPTAGIPRGSWGTCGYTPPFEKPDNVQSRRSCFGPSGSVTTSGGHVTTPLPRKPAVATSTTPHSARILRANASRGPPPASTPSLTTEPEEQVTVAVSLSEGPLAQAPDAAGEAPEQLPRPLMEPGRDRQPGSSRLRVHGLEQLGARVSEDLPRVLRV